MPTAGSATPRREAPRCSHDEAVEAGLCARPGYTTVSGRVVDEETEIPLEGAVVTASRFEEGTLHEHHAQAGEDGTFVLCGLSEEERFRLVASLGSLRSEDRTVLAGRERGAIVLAIDHGDPGIVAVRVVDDATGEPVDGAMIRLDPHPLGAITNERGLAGLRAVPPGEYSLRAEHIAYASFEGTMRVADRSAEEYEIRLRPTAIAVAPLEVTITGRDPVLLQTGFYDRMAELEEGWFYDYWDIEPYYRLSAFSGFKTFLFADRVITFVNGRPFERLGYESLDEIPFGQVRGFELIRCVDLPTAMSRLVDDFDLAAQRQRAGYFDCWAQLIWRGERRVRSEREKPTDRCANERREEMTCRDETGSEGT